ncbi:MAG: tetratricopeptide repeat protein [Isosphaeraceae bacterium]
MTDHEEALELVHRGWDHLRRERPIAARACWQHALRLSPGDPAATRALDTLQTSPELPEAARKEWRLRPPSGEGRRLRWDQALRRGDLGDLERASAAFRDLVDSDADDHEARFNRALCLAWLGRNLPALRELRQLVARSARAQPDAAAEAWALAEILRAGAGAEPEADDLSHAWTLPLGPGETAPRGGKILRPVSLSADAPAGAARVFEWLDRDFPAPEVELQAEDLPRVLATWVETPGQLRLSSPDPVLLEEAIDRLGPHRERGDRTATPLPLPLLDAGLWTFRLPPGLDLNDRRRLTREAAEHRLEDGWIHWPRHGLDGASPIQAARKAAEGDPEAMAMLSAVVRVREQLGERTSTSELYGGYPFARLRRRLGLPIGADEPAPEVADRSCAGLPELAALDPSGLDDPSLAEAAASAAGLGDDAITRKIAEALFDRGPKAIGFAARALPKLVAAGVRRSLAQGDESAALRWLERAEEADPDRRASYATWRAEVLGGMGDAEGAARAYSDAIDLDPDAERALEAAESLRLLGLPEAAYAIAERARDLADSPEDRARSEAILASLRDGIHDDSD